MQHNVSAGAKLTNKQTDIAKMKIRAIYVNVSIEELS